MAKEKIWYAVMTDLEDTDWGYGSHNLCEAKDMARNYGKDAYIAVINEGTEPICVREIHQNEF